jgi:choice-of-anchor B domain-containing protein
VVIPAKTWIYSLYYLIGSDIWGWTDPLTGKEYALVGQTTGTAFVDISDPVNPIFKGTLNTATTSSLWRDIKVYKNHAYIVAESTDHGIQVFDLTQLRAEGSGKTFTATARFTDEVARKLLWELPWKNYVT